MLLALAAIPVLIAVAVRLSSSVPAGRGPAFLDRITQNGLFVAVTAMLVSVPLFLPLTIGVVAGDTIAGEASLGTLRYLLVAPAGPRPAAAGQVRRRIGFLCGRARLRWPWPGQPSVRRCFPSGRSRCCPGTWSSRRKLRVRLVLIAAYLAVSLAGLSAIGLVPVHPDGCPGGCHGRHGGAVRGLPGPGPAAPAGMAASRGCSATTGSASRTCCASRSCGTPSAAMRCCRPATWPCSGRSPTAGSSPRTCCPEAVPAGLGGVSSGRRMGAAASRPCSSGDVTPMPSSGLSACTTWPFPR